MFANMALPKHMLEVLGKLLMFFYRTYHEEKGFTSDVYDDVCAAIVHHTEHGRPTEPVDQTPWLMALVKYLEQLTGPVSHNVIVVVTFLTRKFSVRWRIANTLPGSFALRRSWFSSLDHTTRVPGNGRASRPSLRAHTNMVKGLESLRTLAMPLHLWLIP